MKRAEAKNPFAMTQLGVKRHLEGDHERVFEYLTKAAELGYAGAHYELSVLYREGEDDEEDKKKELYHLEEAVIAVILMLDATLDQWKREEQPAPSSELINVVETTVTQQQLATALDRLCVEYPMIHPAGMAANAILSQFITDGSGDDNNLAVMLANSLGRIIIIIIIHCPRYARSLLDGGVVE
eukprot:scaffold9984_cov148-Skeletonema_dohrnii-CCMP3373.AAC.13